jgi:2-polyprenyl-3-methyl-5-hydroxy-6-metoxy-1,4-benzoquinol methylase
MDNKNKRIIALYEELSKISNIDIITSGRYIFSGLNYDEYLAKEITEKLELNRSDNLIDIGCNVGIYHKYLRNKVNAILGIDAGQEIITKAKGKNQYANVEYLCMDVLSEDLGKINRKYNKVLVYSVVHFFSSIDEVRSLLRNIMRIVDDEFVILLGEVRDKSLYQGFKDSTSKGWKLSARNIRFYFNKLFNSFYLKGLPAGEGCTVFEPEEIFNAAAEFGLRAELVNQGAKNPFANTCVDYIIRKKRETN